MSAEMDQLRHAEERGKILRALKEEYSRPMTSFRTLIGTMDLLGHSLTYEGMQFHLQYLADAGYIRCWRTRELPNWRTDRISNTSGDTIVFAKLLPLGLHLIDGKAPEDAGVRF